MRDDFARMHNEYLDPDRYFSSQDTEGKSAEVHIDLKWSLWTQDEGIWEERAPEVLKMLRMMLNNTLVIHTAPKKEIRYGTVTITGTSESEDAPGDLKAWGRFSACWDEPADLMNTFGLNPDDDEEYQCFVDSLPWAGDDGIPGTYVDFKVQATSVAELLRLIDDQEDQLLRDENQLWKELEAAYQKGE